MAYLSYGFVCGFGHQHMWYLCNRTHRIYTASGLKTCSLQETVRDMTWLRLTWQYLLTINYNTTYQHFNQGSPTVQLSSVKQLSRLSCTQIISRHEMNTI